MALNQPDAHSAPSSGGPNKPAPLQRTPSTHKRSGQTGHKGTTLCKSETPNAIVKLRPSHCTGCQAALDDQSGVGQPSIRQVFNLPVELRLHVT